MINKNQIIRRADADEVPAATVERDYVLTHALCAIAAEQDAQGMVFKGGTALRMCYFTEYRYSADLDFSLIDGLTRTQATDAVRHALQAARTAIGLPMLELREDPEHSSPPRIVYQGPLGRERQIKLDLAANELVIEARRTPLLTRYPDQPPDVLTPAYTLQEIAAEKLRCVIQRQQCRDLFDLHALFTDQDISPEEIWPVFEHKARHRDIDPASFRERFEHRTRAYRNQWDAEMQEHVPGLPPNFDTLLRAVRRHLRPWLRD